MVLGVGCWIWGGKREGKGKGREEKGIANGRQRRSRIRFWISLPRGGIICGVSLELSSNLFHTSISLSEQLIPMILHYITSSTLTPLLLSPIPHIPSSQQPSTPSLSQVPPSHRTLLTQTKPRSHRPHRRLQMVSLRRALERSAGFLQDERGRGQGGVGAEGGAGGYA